MKNKDYETYRRVDGGVIPRFPRKQLEIDINIKGKEEYISREMKGYGLI